MNSSADDGLSSRLDHVNDPHSHGIDQHHLIGPQRVAVRSRCGRLGEHAVWQWMQRDPGRHLLADTDTEILPGGGALEIIHVPHVSKRGFHGRLADRFGRNLGIARRARQAGVAEQHLDDADVGSVLQKMVAKLCRRVCTVTCPRSCGGVEGSSRPSETSEGLGFDTLDPLRQEAMTIAPNCRASGFVQSIV